MNQLFIEETDAKVVGVKIINLDDYIFENGMFLLI